MTSEPPARTAADVEKRKLEIARVLSMSHVIWTCGVVEMLQRNAEPKSRADKRIVGFHNDSPDRNFDDDHLERKHEGWKEDVCRLGEALFPLLCLARIRCRFSEKDTEYVLRLGCISMYRNMRKEFSLVRYDDDSHSIPMLVSSLASRNRRTAGTIIFSVLGLVKEDLLSWSCPVIKRRRRFNVNVLECACLFSDWSTVEWLVDRYKLTKRDFLDLMPTSPAIATAFCSAKQMPVLLGLANKFRLGRDDFYPSFVRRNAFLLAVRDGASEQALWAVEKLHLDETETATTVSDIEGLIATKHGGKLLKYGFANLWPNHRRAIVENRERSELFQRLAKGMFDAILHGHEDMARAIAECIELKSIVAVHALAVDALERALWVR